MTTDQRLREHESVVLEVIKSIDKIGNGEADIYCAGMVMAVAGFLMERRGGRRVAYDYFQGFADDIVNPILERS